EETENRRAGTLNQRTGDAAQRAEELVVLFGVHGLGEGFLPSIVVVTLGFVSVDVLVERVPRLVGIDVLIERVLRLVGLDFFVESLALVRLLPQAPTDVFGLGGFELVRHIFFKWMVLHGRVLLYQSRLSTHQHMAAEHELRWDPAQNAPPRRGP